MESLKKFREFLTESWHEVRHKVTWPSKAEVLGTTRVVMMATVVFALVVGVMDLALYWIVNKVFDFVS